MMKNRGIWVALGVLAVAAVLMFFVVLPQMRGEKPIEDMAKKASDAVEKAKVAVNDAGEAVKDTAVKAGDDVKTATLAKMARLKSDTDSATKQFQALYEGGKVPTADQLAAARANIETALSAAKDFKLPAGMDAATSGMAARFSAAADEALASVKALPTDAAAAKVAIDGAAAKLASAFAGEDTAAKPADTATKVENTDAAATDQSKSIMPGFDVLRVEPDGSTVIAGHAEPGAKLEILDGDKVISSVVAGESGDFAAVLDTPLDKGDHAIVIKSTSKDGKVVTSDEVATVSVPKDASGELLAMVTKPGEASRIMTMPEAKKTGEVADAKTIAAEADKTAAESAKVAETKVAEAAQTETADSTKPADTVKSADATADTVKPADTAQAGDASKTTDVAKQADIIATPDLPDASKELAGNAPVIGTEVTAEQKTALAKAEDTAKTENQDAATVADNKKPADAAGPEVQVSAVEIEGNKIFIAGGAKPNSTVRVYADDKLVAEVKVDETGRFVADNTLPLVVGNHTIRADVLSADGKKVEYRASVPFFRPEGDQLAAVANDGADSSKKLAMQPVADGTFDKARDEATKAMALLKGLYADGKTPSAEELAAARSSTEIALKTLSELHLPDNVDPAVQAMAAKAATEATKAFALLKALPKDAGAIKSALGAIEAGVGLALAPAMEVAANDTVKKADGTTPVAKTDVVKKSPDGAAETDNSTDAKAAEDKATAKKEATAADSKTASGDDATATASDAKPADVDTKPADAAAKADAATAAQPDAAKPADGTDVATTNADKKSSQGGDDVNTAADQKTQASDSSDVAESKDAAPVADGPKVIEQAPLQQSESSVIIRRGDTLWQISRRVYGKGVRYTTIYLANEKQISNPDKIMPGQIFGVPDKPLDNAEELHKERMEHKKK